MNVTEFLKWAKELLKLATTKAKHLREIRTTSLAMYWEGVRDTIGRVLENHPDTPGASPSDQEIVQILKENISYVPQAETIVIHGAIEKLREREREAFEKGFNDACRKLLQYNRMWNDPGRYRLSDALKAQQQEILADDDTPLSILFDIRPNMAKMLALSFASWVTASCMGLIVKKFDGKQNEGWRKFVLNQPDLFLTDDQVWDEYKKYYHENLEDIFNMRETH